MDAQQILLNVGGGLLLLILGWALYSLVNSISKRIDDLGASINARIDDQSANLNARITDVASRLNGIETSLNTIQKDLSEVVGWVQAHGPIHPVET